ncbi:DNA-binding SARP family transcriptional activator [Isoptericola jiangsuensis]|uniref:DNA-binding SARP family transcriptional activator n=1 Tax=Isoptericola jiangsuensis TaxID=548579 RepID=A0A2A9EX45_9MICO|nr:BTAD domain-containing putative transcriptional regulator [Isoptericola jiangsuensis]PFG43146.1 DNA-binding SARP family transcriptional activator [Isoptericola jiangsuensis]
MTSGRSTGLDITLLDGFHVTGTSAELPPAVRRLVAHVSLTHRPDRGVVAGRLWPDVTESAAQANLRSALWRLHRIAPGLLDTAGGRLRVADGVGVDVHRLCAWAHEVVSCPEQDATGLPADMSGGELLPGWCDAWVEVERERLRQLRLHALEVLARRLTRAERYGEAMEAALAAVETEPLRESAHRAVVGIHLAEGNVAEAVRHYRRFRELLADELGLPPSPLMERLLHDGLPDAGAPPPSSVTRR